MDFIRGAGDTATTTTTSFRLVMGLQIRSNIALYVRLTYFNCLDAIFEFYNKFLANTFNLQDDHDWGLLWVCFTYATVAIPLPVVSN